MPNWLLRGVSCSSRGIADPVFALLNVVSGYHDTLLSTHLDPSLSLPPHPFDPPTRTVLGDEPKISQLNPVLPPPSDHSRYTRYWSEKSGLYKKASRLLVTIGYVELLVEMLSKKRLGQRRRWNYILGLESVK